MYQKDGRVAQIRGKSAERPSYEMADERDVIAAQVLVGLANCVSGLPENDLQSFRRSPGVFRIPGDELLTNVLADGKRQNANRLEEDGKIKVVIGEKSNFPTSKANHVERKHNKRKVENNFSMPPSKKYRNQCITEEEEKNSLHEIYGLSDGCGLTSRPCKKDQHNIDDFVNDGHDGLGMGSLESKKMTKKRKTKANRTYLDGWNAFNNLRSGSKKLFDEPTSLKKKSGLQKVGVETVTSGRGVIDDMLLSEDASLDDGVSVIKPAKGQQFTLITPTLHTGFSFSIIHLLSAVRMALLTPHAEDFASALGEQLGEGHRRSSECKDIPNRNCECANVVRSCENWGVISSEQAEENNVPSLTIHEIVLHIRSKPGDPCILETQEPLLDLVRGVLRIFSSRTAPLGEKCWKPLTAYEKSSKRWSWIGPVPSNMSGDDGTNAQTSSKAWCLPHKMLVRLVDCFANWLKNGQESLKQIGTLPAPPVVLMQLTNGNERFKDMRAQRSLSTISPSSDEVRTYFRREETLRYLIPERVFSYTALDGRKSTVAPIRRCSGKPSKRARDHFMLKNNRPPHVTILCLVRDAAARLPGSIGTRSDVCTLIRDSQFVVDDISDLQVNQVVSGALDRLHYELDPCVKFNRDRHLWVYLHGEREEDDFESDGTSRRKCKWKREMLERNLT